VSELELSIACGGTIIISMKMTGLADELCEAAARMETGHYDFRALEGFASIKNIFTVLTGYFICNGDAVAL
jgi:hypothetical protein